MTTIYVVTESGGGYDDAYTINRGATEDRVKAEVYLKKLQKEQSEHNALVDKLQAIERAINEKLGPVKVEKFLDRHNYPPGLGKHQITQEMKNERLKIELLNNKIHERNNVAYAERHELIKAAKQELLKSLGMTDYYEFYYERATFDIDEVEAI